MTDVHDASAHVCGLYITPAIARMVRERTEAPTFDVVTVNTSYAREPNGG
jgi:hypothetical protein